MFILAIQELYNEEQQDKDLFTKKKGIVASVLDTEDNEVFPRPTGLALSVDG